MEKPAGVGAFGSIVGMSIAAIVAAIVGAAVGAIVGAAVGAVVGAGVAVGLAVLHAHRNTTSMERDKIVFFIVSSIEAYRGAVRLSSTKLPYFFAFNASTSFFRASI